MQVSTRDFGLVTVEPENIIEFQQPMFGFEISKTISCCTMRKSASILHGCNPLKIPGYASCWRIRFNPSQIQRRGPSVYPPCSRGRGLRCWTVLAVPDNFSKATVNLKSPVLINTHNHQAAQIILDGDYPIRCPLKKEEPSHADAVEKNQ